MLFSECIQIVRALLESFPAPEVVVLKDDADGDLMNRIGDAMEALDIGELTYYRHFHSFNPACFNDEFKTMAKECIPWAFWKIVVIPEIIRSAALRFFDVHTSDCEMEAWHHLGKLMLESVFSAKWTEDCMGGLLFPSSECGYCCGKFSEPTLFPGCHYRFHLDCYMQWIMKNDLNECPTCKWLDQRFYQCVRCTLVITDWDDGHKAKCGCYYHKVCLRWQVKQNLHQCCHCRTLLDIFTLNKIKMQQQDSDEWLFPLRKGRRFGPEPV